MSGQHPRLSPRQFPEGAVTESEDCLPCKLEDADENAVVFRDELWASEVTPGFEVPGWFVLRSRRHALGWQELNRAELDSFGAHAQALVSSVTEVFGSPATYLLNFGEAFPHFHCLVAARGHKVPPEARLGQIMTLRASRLDWAESLSYVPAVRELYRALSSR